MCLITAQNGARFMKIEWQSFTREHPGGGSSVWLKK